MEQGGRTLREQIRDNLASAMEAAGLSQVQLAQRLGISKGTVNNWIRGYNAPDVDMVPRICQALGVPIAALYAGLPGGEGTGSAAPPAGLSAPALELARTYERLDQPGRNVVRLVAAEEARRVESQRVQGVCGESGGGQTRLIPLYGHARGVWQSLFTSVSAFCNAGFDLFGGYRSLTHLQNEPVILLTLGGLILVCGLGFPVILECLRARFRWRKLPLHAKLVLTVTAGLIAFGTLSILALEWVNPRTLDGGLTVWQKLYNSLFQSITFRTAGFASLDQASLTDPSKLIGSVLMFVGTSSASTGGGVKTTTAALLALVVVQVVRGHERITVFGREISADTARRAVAIVLIAFSAILIATCVISVIERGRGHDFLDLLFETTSAFSTTGLSSVNTTTLTPASQWLLMPLMYFGRVGPLTLAYALANRLESRRANRVHYPEEKIMIG